MLVVDTNILIRAVLGRRVRQLLDTYAGHGTQFFAPDAAFQEAERYLPVLVAEHARSDIDLLQSLAYLEKNIELVPLESYREFEKQARSRLFGRDEDDWPVLATALATGAAIWSED